MYTIQIKQPTELRTRTPSRLTEAVAQPGTTLHSQTVHHLNVLGIASSFKLSLKEELDLDREDMALYSATLYPMHSDSSNQVSAHPEQQHEGLEVICKITCEDMGLEDLRNEADIFADQLESLQGNHVPRCFGYFEEESGDSKTQMGLLLLERVGLQLQRPLRVLPMRFSTMVLEALHKIHDVGILVRTFSHQNVFWSNFRDPDAKPFIYNFDAAILHDCERDEALKARGARPLPQTIKCDEMFEAWDAACLWPPTPRILKKFLRVDDDEVDSAAELVNIYYSRFPETSSMGVNSESVRIDAERAFAYIEAWRKERAELDQQPLKLELQPGEYFSEIDL